MQFSVPQFTEVEDKIIGPLTVKQFGIIFGGGILVFVPYTLTKSVIVLIFFALLIGLPTLGLAFARLNGRPMYNMFGYFVAFLTSPKILVFHKEGSLVSDRGPKDNAAVAEVNTASLASPPKSSRQRIQEVNKMLQEKAEEERKLIK